MITNFKIFENLSVLPQVGDYVILNEEEFVHSAKDFYNFIFSKPIGQIIKKDVEHGGSAFVYHVKFNIDKNGNLIDFFNDGVRRFSINYFEIWSKNKEDLEKYLATKKYNI